MSALSEVFSGEVGAYNYVVNTPERLGKKLGELGLSETAKGLIAAHLETNTPGSSKTLEGCATSFVAGKAHDHLDNGELKNLTGKLSSGGQCNAEQWAEGMTKTLAEELRNRAIEAAGPGAQEVLEFMGSATEIVAAHERVVEKLAAEGKPGFLHGTMQIGGIPYEYHVDASGIKDPDKNEDSGVKISLKRADGVAIEGDDRVNPRALRAAEAALRNQALEGVHQYEQNGQDYGELLEKTIADYYYNKMLEKSVIWAEALPAEEGVPTLKGDTLEKNTQGYSM